MKKKSIIILFLTCLILYGCANFKQLNDFASSSYQGIEKFESLPVNFKRLCLDNCREQDIKNGSLKEGACDCASAGLADSADYLMYKTLANYLDGLEKLSADELTTYQFDSLATQLTSEKLGSVKITPEQAGAFAKLNNILFKSVTDRYRRGKIREYIKEGNEPLKVITHYLKLNIEGDLIQELRNQDGKLRGAYVSLLKNNGGTYEQRKIIEEYYARKLTISDQSDQLKAYARLLQTIADGHQKLAENADNQDKAKTNEMISQYTDNINYIRAQIQALKK